MAHISETAYRRLRYNYITAYLENKVENTDFYKHVKKIVQHLQSTIYENVS